MEREKPRPPMFYFELLFRVCHLPINLADLHALFLRICDLEAETSDVEGLGDGQRTVVRESFHAACVHLRHAVLNPLQGLGAREMDLLHLLALQHTCEDCPDHRPVSYTHLTLPTICSV